MGDRESRYFEAREEVRHMATTNCLACAAGWVHDCTDDDQEDDA